MYERFDLSYQLYCNDWLVRKVKHLVLVETRCFKNNLRFLFGFAFYVVWVNFWWNNDLREIVVPIGRFYF